MSVSWLICGRTGGDDTCLFVTWLLELLSALLQVPQMVQDLEQSMHLFGRWRLNRVESRVERGQGVADCGRYSCEEPVEPILHAGPHC